MNTATHDEITILVTGSRVWWDHQRLTDILDTAAFGYRVVTLMHGKCDPRLDGVAVKWETAEANPHHNYLGADWLAHRHAVLRNWKVEPHPADWPRFGLAAGPRRNAAMVEKMIERKSKMVLGFPLGESRGTRNCLGLALWARLPLRTEEGVELP